VKTLSSQFVAVFIDDEYTSRSAFFFFFFFSTDAANVVLRNTKLSNLPKVHVMDSNGSARAPLRLAVGVALVPVGALIALTEDRKE